MCGRFETNHGNDSMKEILNNLSATENYEFLRNGDVYPTDKSAVLIANNGEIIPQIYNWGYDKYSSKGVIINARSESVTEKPMFSGDFKARRCIVPSTGFYEWSKNKNKFIFRAATGGLLYMAALYKNLKDKNAFVILTKDAAPPVSQIHHRMPLLITSHDILQWLTNYDFAEFSINSNMPFNLICK